ncbi:hypothetical protein ANG6_1509 [Streptococcus anginosus T5]|uniref:Uncharacterized protein n=4 Tax=Streptococcus anginosus group TaxID=671232 RepID=F9P785_STRCV|nr:MULTISPECIES: hypothetical protein [Streptococcus anginosus group]EGV08596.1 hypothetical protein HMPREF1042_1733 [Streptococcus constellatus subsp. pharyngis SK1060 = CCUG 46377]EID22608.1 hypothetical protein HMPREF1044_1397 [Streptococcus constellatus subsp. constellatus SK53]EJP25947.1 hypothetical protein HMPREF1126_1334 [Streptococcus anginosus SK1138]BAN61147.1 hypothetical protein ANG_0677 [Streptococcus anginosus subsp. whileyi MAS624]BBD23102.1 hypothetical protein SCSC_1429 [Stre
MNDERDIQKHIQFRILAKIRKSSDGRYRSNARGWFDDQYW